MIVVTGANGKLGRTVVEHLLTLTAPDEVGVSVRDPRKASGLAAQGVRVRRGDFADPASLADAFDGATQVLLVSVDQIGDAAVSMHAAAIDAAKAVGVKRIVYTSHMGARPDSSFAAAPDHAATEVLLRDSGLPYVALRNGFYANTPIMLIDQALQTGTLIAPEDGAVNWTSPADLAEAAAKILNQDGEWDGGTAPLAASDAFDLDTLAAVASDVHGRQISRVTVSDGQYRDTRVAGGTPAQFADFFIGMFSASRSGDFHTDDRTLEGLLGRPTTSIRDVLMQAAVNSGSHS